MTQPLPLTSTAAVLLALMLVTGGGPSAASQAVPATKPAAPDTPDAHLGRGYDALRDDKYEIAVTEFRTALKLDP